MVQCCPSGRLTLAADRDLAVAAGPRRLSQVLLADRSRASCSRELLCQGPGAVDRSFTGIACPCAISATATSRPSSGLSLRAAPRGARPKMESGWRSSRRFSFLPLRCGQPHRGCNPAPGCRLDEHCHKKHRSKQVRRDRSRGGWSDIIDVVRDSSPFSVSVFLPTNEQRIMIVHMKSGAGLPPSNTWSITRMSPVGDHVGHRHHGPDVGTSETM